MKQAASRTGAVYRTGERGRNRVRLVADRRTGVLALEYRGDDGRKARTSCKTHDVALGKQMADALAARLAAGVAPARAVTLKALFDNYDAEVGAASNARRQNRRAAENVVNILGNVRADTLKASDLRRFMAERRRRGDQRSKSGRPVGARVIAFDVKVLLAVLRWAVREGRLERNPVEGFRVPAEANPRRPVLSREDYAALLAVADAVHPYCSLLLVLAHQTGHRLGALLALRWEDVKPDRTVIWRAASDKKRREHVTPLTDTAVTALDARAATLLAEGQAPQGLIFPDGHGEPVTNYTAIRWWRRMEQAAGLAHEDGRGWHSLRRMFASEMATLTSTAALARLGGWADVNTLSKCYVLPSPEQLRPVLERRA